MNLPRHLLSVGVAAAFVFLAFGSGEADPAASGGGEPAAAAPTAGASAADPIVSDAAAILSIYKKSALVGDERYKGRHLRITGKLKGVKPNKAGETRAFVDTGDPFDMVAFTVAFADPADLAAATALAEGAPIAFEGVCEGAAVMTQVGVSGAKLLPAPAAPSP